MKIAIALLLGFVLAAPDPKEATPDSDGFVSLFDGKTLNGWHGLEGYWSVKDGAITGSETKENSKQTFLIYQQPVGDFELHYKYRFVSKEGNSGVQFRSKVIDEATSRVGGYQADNDGNRGYDGSIYDEAKVAGRGVTLSNRGEKTIWTADNKRQSGPLGESNQELRDLIKANDWNDVVLIAKGHRMIYRINDHLMTDLTDDSPHALRVGVLALQLHQGFTMEVQYKDLKLKPLKQP